MSETVKKYDSVAIGSHIVLDNFVSGTKRNIWDYLTITLHLLNMKDEEAKSTIVNSSSIRLTLLSCREIYKLSKLEIIELMLMCEKSNRLIVNYIDCLCKHQLYMRNQFKDDVMISKLEGMRETVKAIKNAETELLRAYKKDLSYIDAIVLDAIKKMASGRMHGIDYSALGPKVLASCI